MKMVFLKLEFRFNIRIYIMSYERNVNLQILQHWKIETLITQDKYLILETLKQTDRTLHDDLFSNV